MDRYICKAKRMDNGEWVYGLLCYNIYHQLCIQPVEDMGCCVIDPNTVCRCTGKKDRNGNFIFENDIVVGKAGVPMTVCWDDDYAGFDVIYSQNGIGLYCNSLCGSELLEITSNKFDNTELMENQYEEIFISWSENRQ